MKSASTPALRRARRRTPRKAPSPRLKPRDARFRFLAEHSSDLFFSMRFPEGSFEYVSPSYEAVTGHSPQEFYADPGLMSRVTAPPWRELVAAWLEEHRQGRALESCEYQIMDRCGRLRWLHQRQVLAPTPDDRGRLLQGVATDVTALREAQQALGRSEERFRLLAENSRDIFFSFRLPEGRYEFISARVAELFGHAPQGFYDDPGLFLRCVAPEWRETMRGWMTEAAQGTLRSKYEFQVLDRQGRLRWVVERIVLVPAPDAQGMLLQGVLADITDERNAREALAASERKYRTLHESMRDGFAAVDMDGFILEHNNAFREMLGYADEEIRRLTYQDITPARWHAEEARIIREQVLARGYSDVYEKEYRRRDGSVFPVSMRTYLETDAAGQPTRFWALARDITEHTRAESALRMSEERYALALRGANDGIWDWDLVENKVYFSDRWKEIIGYGPDELPHDAEEWISRIHPDDFEALVLENTRCAAGKTPFFQVEYRLRHKDGSYRWILGRGASLVDATGKVVRMAGAHTDITTRKEAEDSLRKSERISRKLLEAMQGGVWAINADKRTTFVNERLCAMLGYSSGELMNMTLLDVLDWPQRDLAEKRLQERMAGASGATDYVLTRKDGSRFPAHVLSSPLMEEQGRFEGLVCSFVDLTERARMEHGLRRNQARFEALYELSRLSPATEQQLASFTLREAIRLTDSAAGVLFFVCPEGQALEPKAWETGEFIAKGVVPSFPADGPLPWAVVCSSGQPLLLNDLADWAGLVPPGHPVPTRFLGVPALDGARPVAVLGLTGKAEPYSSEDTLQVTLLLDGMWRVVRARRDEASIRESLREKDALLHEVHHRVKNNLQVVSSLLDLAGRRLVSPEARLALSEMRDKVQAMSLIHAQLHSPESTGGIRLEPFVRALFNQLREVYSGGLELSLRMELGALALGLDQAVPLGLALNEALANVFKHACPPDGNGDRRASRVEIRAVRDETGQVAIEVQDDGPGLPEGLEPLRAASLGMKLMRGLVCHQLRGALDYAPAAPGVCVRIRFLPHIAF